MGKRVFGALKKYLIIFSLAVFFLIPFFGQAAAVGEQVNFFVDSSYDTLSRATLRAKLIIISERAYIYVEEQWWNSLGSTSEAEKFLRELVSEFDRNIYPKMTQAYGPVWEPGIDGDLKITILFSRLKAGAGGYFKSADEYQSTISPSSNQREMLYLNASLYNSYWLRSLLAHEFQHLITFYNKEKLYNLDEDTWLNEARSEYAPTLLGYDSSLTGSNLEKRISDFSKNPSDSLTEWVNETSDYGAVNLFIQYLVGRFGEQIITKITQNALVGIESMNLALREIGSNQLFSDIFIDWAIANYINDCGVNQKYCYQSVNLKKYFITPSITQSLPTLSTSTISRIEFTKDWAGHWYEFVGRPEILAGSQKDLKIDFQTGGNNFAAIYIIKKNSGENEVKFINLDFEGKGTALINNFGSQVKSVVLIPVSRSKIEDFTDSELARPFYYQASIVENAVSWPPLPDNQNSTSSEPTRFFPEGALLRVVGDTKVYVIKKGLKRWMQSEKIFNAYGHLRWENVIEVSQAELDVYNESWLIRANNDARVYEITPNGVKRWLNMSAGQFLQSGRKWEEIYIINTTERDWYQLGAEIKF